MSQLTFGLMSGETKVRPIEAGDVIVTHKGARILVGVVSDDIHGAVYVGTKLRGENAGATCVVLAREVAYRTNTP